MNDQSRPRSSDGQENLVEVKDLKKWFPVQKGFLDRLLSGHADYVRAVDGISFEIRRGEVFGLAGESGSGKTTTGRLVIGLIEPTSGTVRLDGVDLSTLNAEQLRHERRRMQVIFQDPHAALNPRMSIGAAIGHPVRIHITSDPKQQREMVYRILDRVGLAPPQQFYDKFPHQLSGGQQQRAVIARALVTTPDLVLADEPIAMADVSVRALLLDLMIRLKDELQLTYLFITHDLATAKYICDRIGIMYLGKLVEVGDLRAVYANPQHPYTEALLAAVPVPNPHKRRTQPMPQGEIPNPINPPSGCRFHPRCPIAIDVCSQIEPPLLDLGGGHWVACHLRQPGNVKRKT
ncbi:MAG TPA: ABC transporter ATP-binding protein [Anaerolineae bacterium]